LNSSLFSCTSGTPTKRVTYSFQKRESKNNNNKLANSNNNVIRKLEIER